MFLIEQLSSWFTSILNSLGLAHKDAKILFLGLDNAGKTTLLHVLRDDRVSQHNPTLHPHSEELVMGKIKFRTFDLGGHETARRLWKQYFATVDGIIFLVDAADQSRFPEAAEELQQLLSTQELSSVPVVIFGNKIDIRGAASEDDFRRQMGVPAKGFYGASKMEGVRPVEVFMCSVVKRMGYSEGFQWLSQYLD